MRIGIIFGGSSREREISFAGGRTVYDNLNKSLFTAVPLFVDSIGNIIELDWQYIYKGTIRDFYPPIEFLPTSEYEFQIYAESLLGMNAEQQSEMISRVGQKIELSDLNKKIDFAFLCLHGNFGEDGKIQSILEFYSIPYSGSGVLPSAIGMDKSFQKKMMEHANFSVPKVIVLDKKNWNQNTIQLLYARIEHEIGFPCVIRPANQGSSIGVSILSSDALITDVSLAIEKSFFQYSWNKSKWQALSSEGKIELIKKQIDLREGIGLPLRANNQWIYTPSALLEFLNSSTEENILLEGKYTDNKIIIESFIDGREFSCIVIRNLDGGSIALPPTEIIKGTEIYDYRSKYLPGLSRKVTPIDIDAILLAKIRTECVRLFELFEFNTYARIDGFIKSDGTIILNDPNTTSGMLPSSFFFHQAAEIGLNPSQFLSYIIRTSLWERIDKQLDISNAETLLQQLDNKIAAWKNDTTVKKKIGVIMGGYSFERHISMESGRNIYEKLASSNTYEPIPLFLLGDPHQYQLVQIPIHFMLKDNADDIRYKINHDTVHPAIANIRSQCADLLNKFGSKDYSFHPQIKTYDILEKELFAAFIALHGRPGEDGTVQRDLESYKIPYNGSGPQSSSLTIHKYNTLQTLKNHGFVVADQLLITKQEYLENINECIHKIHNTIHYPFIAKPVDDGCSSAVLKINNDIQLQHYLQLLFRDNVLITSDQRQSMALDNSEEFPQKEEVLIEELIKSHGAQQFLEITGGLLTHGNRSNYTYEIFDPSEALSSGEVLSLEEKFLAGEGQNITPPRFGKTKAEYKIICDQVKHDLQRAASILNVQGYARIDAFVRVFEDLRAETVIIEVNSLPGMTPATCIFHQTALNGYKPYDFINKIIEFGSNESNGK